MMGRRKDKDISTNVIDENRYKEWLEFIFSEEDVNSDLYDEEFEANDDEVVELIQQTCIRCGTDLKNHSHNQINQGLNRLFNPSIDNYTFSFRQSGLHYNKIVVALQSLKHLYLDLFNERCDPVLSHLDESTDNELNSICYMLWDVTPLAFWDDNPNSKHYYSAIAMVMEKALYLSNPACVESGLHGLGHIQCEAKESVAGIIDRFLKKQKGLRQELIQYANNAKTGYIQ